MAAPNIPILCKSKYTSNMVKVKVGADLGLGFDMTNEYKLWTAPGLRSYMTGPIAVYSLHV